MINLKNILKVLLVALFVCAYSGNVWARNDEMDVGNRTLHPTETVNTSGKAKTPTPTTTTTETKKEDPAPKTEGMSSTQNFVSKCGESMKGGDNKAIFSELICTGVLIFNQLRDLIYVVAGFGIIAVAVGGFFGNLNWKWLGAIAISLVVIASAGELISLLTGGEVSSSLIKDTLKEPAPLVGAGAETAVYNNNFIDPNDPDVDRRIKWDVNVERDAIYDASSEY